MSPACEKANEDIHLFINWTFSFLLLNLF